MLNLTDVAVKKLKDALKQGNVEDHGVRIYLAPGG